MGWDRLLVLVSPPLKSLLKGPPPSLQGIPPIWSAGLFQKASSPTATCVQTSSHRLERPTILQYSDFRKVVARVHRGRKLLGSTVEGSCSIPQKEETAQIYRGESKWSPQRRRLLKYFSPQSQTTWKIKPNLVQMTEPGFKRERIHSFVLCKS